MSSRDLEQTLNNDLQSLRDCKPGTTVTICCISPDLGCAQRLRELGIVEGSMVLLMKQEDPVLLFVKDSRIAIDPLTATQILVSSLPGGAANAEAAAAILPTLGEVEAGVQRS